MRVRFALAALAITAACSAPRDSIDAAGVRTGDTAPEAAAAEVPAAVGLRDAGQGGAGGAADPSGAGGSRGGVGGTAATGTGGVAVGTGGVAGGPGTGGTAPPPTPPDAAGPVSCPTGYDDCNASVPGCETRIDTINDCGACGVRCQTDESCKAGACACAGAICDGVCVDVTSNADHCGACGVACAGTCANRACVCPSPDPRNLLRNGGFDRGLEGWYPEPALTASLDTSDSAGCPGSRAVRITYGKPMQDYHNSYTQCVRGLVPGARYNLGGWFRIGHAGTPDLSSMYVIVDWHKNDDCQFTNELAPASATMHLMTRDTDGVRWHHKTTEAMIPAGTRSASFRITVVGGANGSNPITAGADMVYLTPVPGRW